MKNERLDYIDTAKGIAIVLVVCGHVYSMLEMPSNAVLNIIGSLHNPVFFLSSGILFSVKHECRKQTGQVVRRQGIRLLIPFAIWCVIYTIFGKILEEVVDGSVIFGLSAAVNKLWFLPVLFFAVCIVSRIEEHQISNRDIVILFLISLVVSVFLSSMIAKIIAYTFLVWIGAELLQYDEQKNILASICITVWAVVTVTCYLTNWILPEDGAVPGCKLLIILISSVTGGIGVVYLTDVLAAGGVKSKAGYKRYGHGLEAGAFIYTFCITFLFISWKLQNGTAVVLI